MQEHIAHPVGECRSLPPRDALKRGVLALRFAIDHCILSLEATLGLVSSLAVPPLAVGGRDADV